MKNVFQPLIAVGLTASGVFAADIGYFTDNGSNAGQAAVITAAGHTPVLINNISTFNFNTVQAVFLNEAANFGSSSDLFARISDLSSYVSNGGHLILHDRFVAAVAGTPSSHLFLFGQPGIQVQRDFNNGSDIDLLPAGVTAFPSLNNTSLDGGNFSSHGFGFATSLPVTATSYLNRGGAPSEVVSFQYGFGLGSVYYSTIPLDFYLLGNGDLTLNENMATMATDVLIAVLGPTPVPEPAEYAAMAGVGLIGFALWRRSRKA